MRTISTEKVKIKTSNILLPLRLSLILTLFCGVPSLPVAAQVAAPVPQPPPATQATLTPETLLRMRESVQQVYVDPSIVSYSVALVTGTRAPTTVQLADLDRYVTYGASPRASIALVLGGRALAFLRGRDYVLPHDVRELALDVLRHRIVLSYEALADDVDPDTIIGRVLQAVPMPEVALQDR